MSVKNRRLGFLLFFLGYGKCLVLWALPHPEELDGVIPKVKWLAWESLEQAREGRGTLNRTLVRHICHWIATGI